MSGSYILSAYCLYAFPKYFRGSIAPSDMKFWATTILIFIGIGIILTIIIQIAFHILLSIEIAIRKRECDEKEIEKSLKIEMQEDERDQLVELKSMRIAFAFFGIGFLVALLTLLLNYSTAVMINVLFFGGCIGSIFEGLVQLYYYRKGM